MSRRYLPLCNRQFTSFDIFGRNSNTNNYGSIWQRCLNIFAIILWNRNNKEPPLLSINIYSNNNKTNVNRWIRTQFKLYKCIFTQYVENYIIISNNWEHVLLLTITIYTTFTRINFTDAILSLNLRRFTKIYWRIFTSNIDTYRCRC